ncbi:MAG: DUF3810 domain-containing protein [Firmicutes bacterium]|nr:DUF3810 domain-containing protein [Bacillota bacterium]
MKEKTKKLKPQVYAAEKKKSCKGLIILSSFIAFFAALLTALILLRKSDVFTEFMVTRVSRGILMIMGKTSSALPFSAYELFLYLIGAAIISCLTVITVLLLKKRWAKSLSLVLAVILTALVFANIYFVSAGYSYNRYEEYHPVLNPELSKAQTVAVAEYFIDDFNTLAKSFVRDEKGTIIPPYDNVELSYRLQQEFFRLSGFDINPYTPRCKTIVSSRIMSEMHIRGVFFAPFGEPNVNSLVPPAEMPFTMAHEMAHAKGIMREDDADNTALYVTLTSDDPYIRYSAYNEYIFSMLSAVLKWDNIEKAKGEDMAYWKLRDKISPLITREWQNSVDHWSRYYRLSSFLRKINDFYLKLMGQGEGVNAYIPPATGEESKTVTDPGGNPVTDPGGKPVTVTVPKYNSPQQIFFQAYVESRGSLPQKAE